MKKFVKLLLAGLLVSLIALSFCSCKELDEVRESRAIYGETEEVLIFRGDEYKLLPLCEYLYIEADNNGSVTDEDVPILLSEMYGQYMYFDNSAEFIVSDTWPNSDGVNKVYCRSDRYSEMCEKIENLEMNYYCYRNPRYNPHNSGLIYRAYSLLPQNATEILQNALTGEGIPTELDYDECYILNEIQCCDETLTFIDNINLIILVENDGQYSFMIHYQNKDYLKYELSSEDAMTLLNILELV